MRGFVAVTCVAMTALVSPAHAGSDTHYQDAIVGERAGGMGGAFTALADEATGPYYNPAGLVRGQARLLQVSMSAYKLRRKNVTLADYCGSELSDDQSALFSLPASLGFANNFEAGEMQHAFGLTVAVPHADRVANAASLNGATCGALQLDAGLSQITVDRVFRGGLTYAVQPAGWLRLGAMAGLSVRGYSASHFLSVVTTFEGVSSPNPTVQVVNLEATVWAMHIGLGAIVEPAPGVRLGLAFTTPQLQLTDAGRIDIVTSEPDPEVDPDLTFLDNASFYWRVPFGLRLGVAYTRPERFTVALDADLHGSVAEHENIAHELLPEDTSDRVSRNMVTNLNAGAELYIGDSMIARAGLFTNFSAQPRLDSTSAEDAPDRVDLYGATLGIGYYDERSVLSLAIQGQYGIGQVGMTRVAFQKDTGEFTEETVLSDVEELMLIVTFGGSYDLQ